VWHAEKRKAARLYSLSFLGDRIKEKNKLKQKLLFCPKIRDLGKDDSKILKKSLNTHRFIYCTVKILTIINNTWSKYN